MRPLLRIPSSISAAIGHLGAGAVAIATSRIDARSRRNASEALINARLRARSRSSAPTIPAAPTTPAAPSPVRAMRIPSRPS